MHEVSIAQNIAELIRENISEGHLSRVTAVTLEIGSASGVVADSLHFAFDALKQQLPFSSAVLKSTIVPFVVRCNECGKQSENDAGLMLCSECGSTDVTIISGTELILKQIELNDQ